MDHPIISFKDYGFKYRSQTEATLRHINLDIKKGEKILIIGPSGSGKSTLSNCLNGLIPFNYAGEVTGELQIKDLVAKEAGIFELSKIVGTVLQDPDGQFVGLTSGEDISFSLENDMVEQEEMKARVLEAAKVVGADQLLDASPYDLSGGQKQRVSMAGVIINQVEVLLFDEPLANLDPEAGRRTILLIDEIMKQNPDVTVLMIEHRLEDALYRKVDRIVLINEGEILADEPADKLLSGSLLKENGIREPLYLTALRYAGVEINQEMHPAQIDTLVLSQEQKKSIKKWYEQKHSISKEAKKEELLCVKNLHFSYEQTSQGTLRDISFKIHKGEMTAIVGTNGAGKSTLAKLICGFETLDSGEILLNGQNIGNKTITDRAKHIGYVLQNPNQMISKTMIYDEVAMGLISRNVKEDEIKKRVDRTLEICGLKPFRKWPIQALSFGQKKRVTIASVLVMNPEIIILDEPTAGQDFQHYNEIMEFLRDLNRQGITVLMITHDMHLMLEYAERALVFSGGELLSDTRPAQILTDKELTKRASLKETSLFDLAQICEIEETAEFVQHFIDYDREVRDHG
ncbi:ABC transporter ATP-binding protein [Lachnospiraceae bacterium OttesenSCG-928-D06]|nr:ABC transporter ATP-binding protein [Lachnospiraceae bacterium OttesenSCG-928-D06]